MALNPNEKFDSAAGKGSSLRCFPHSTQTKEFAAGSGTLAPLTALAYNTTTDKWVVFDADGTNGTNIIKGFLWPDELVLDSDEEVLGVVAMNGRIHVDDIPEVSGSYNNAQLLAALRGESASNVRSLGFVIEGLSKFA